MLKVSIYLNANCVSPTPSLQLAYERTHTEALQAVAIGLQAVKIESIICPSGSNALQSLTFLFKICDFEHGFKNRTSTK